MPTSQYSPENEPLWLNPNLSSTKLFLSNCSRKGVASISYIMFNNGNFLSESQIITKAFNIKTNYLEYHRVGSCTKIYLNKTKSNEKKINIKPAIPNQINLLSKSKKGCKVFYHVLRYPQTISTTNPSWVNKLEIEVNMNT